MWGILRRIGGGGGATTSTQAYRATWKGGAFYRAYWEDGMAETITRLPIHEDFVARFYVEKYTGGGGVGWGAGTGVQTFSVRVALTPNGAALTGLSGTASEEASTGYYAVTFDAASLTSALAAYVGQDVFIVLSKPGDVDGKYKRVRVVEADEVA